MIKQARLLPLACLILISPVIFAGAKKIKKAHATDNPPQYLKFSQPLSQEARDRHALDRLTFGPRPGDLAAIKIVGLQKWVDAQLHPEQTPENPELQEHLAPLESLRMSSREAYIHYPSQQMIAQVARGRAPLPDDPELRAIVARLADRYMAKQQAKAADPVSPPQNIAVSIGSQTVFSQNAPPAGAPKAETTNANNGNDDSDLEPKVKLTDILTPGQIDTLKNGKPDEKREVLESIPPSQRFNFVYALRQPQRQALFTLAPVSLRRELMLAVSPQNVVASDLSEGKLQRAIYSDHQLQELLVDFWFNHFNVYLNKGAERYTVPSYERDVIRPRVYGKFYDLLLETAKSPAMLFYLDNWESVGPNAPENRNPNPNRKIKRGLNENYGRELLELHTLGVDGGYTQQDVINVARCLTGWTIAAPRKGGGFEYNDKMHDKGEKIVLGHRIPAGGGMNDGLEVLNLLAHHPSTAHFISLKLAKRFVADDPPPSLVNRMAATFTATDGDLRKVMETMLNSGEFWSQGAYLAKVKTPLEMVVSAVRATNAQVTSAFLLTNELQRLGEPLYRKIEPTGYSSANAEWVSSASLLDRMNFGLSLASNRVPGVKVDLAAWQTLAQKDPMDLARSLLEQDPSEATRAAIEKALSSTELQTQLMQNAKAGPPRLPSLVAGLALGSPEFQKR